MRIAFGVANVFFNPTTGNVPALPTPQQGITLQDFAIDIDVTVKELRGQFQFPDDTADADRKLSFKAGVGRQDIDLMNNIVFGETAINTGGKGGVINELATIPASTPFTYTVAHGGANFGTDLGVIYTTGPLAGQKLTKVGFNPSQGASGTVPGEYGVTATGVYEFAGADASLGVEISYTYTVTSGRILTVNNHTQGWGPNLEVYAFNPYSELTAGIPNYIHLYACKITKTGLPFKRADYMIMPIEGEAFANAAGQVMDIYED